MRKKTSVILALLLLASAAGCTWAVLTRSRDLPALPTPQRVIVYEGGAVAFETQLEPNSAATAEIKEWLNQHGSGWKPSLVSFAPVQLIEGDGYTLNFHRDRCIANVRAADGTWRQLVKDLEAGQASPDVFQR